MVAAGYLHQTLFGAISACQRLLPFGQSAAMRLLWNLKPQIAEAVEQAHTATLEDLWNIQPALDIASMRHPQLTTRLFIS
jgi:urease accessory protein